MKETTSKSIRALCECAIMVALAYVIDLLCKLIPTDSFLQYGGSISIGVVPIIFISFRHGWKWGMGAAAVNVGIQMLTGFYAPPVTSFGYYLVMILLDYIVAYGVMGIACLFAKPFKNRILGYTVSAVIVNVIRFICHFFTGVIIWNEVFYESADATLGEALTNGGAYTYSLIYNGGYMLFTTIASAVVIFLLCSQVDPKTLKRYKK